MLLCFLGQGTVPHNVGQFPSVLTLVVPFIRHRRRHLQHSGTAWNNAPWNHGDTVPCPKEQYVASSEPTLSLI